MGGIFLAFCKRLQQHKVFKVIQLIIGLEKHLFQSFWVKRGQSGPRMKAFKFSENQCQEPFYLFA